MKKKYQSLIAFNALIASGVHHWTLWKHNSLLEMYVITSMVLWLYFILGMVYDITERVFTRIKDKRLEKKFASLDVIKSINVLGVEFELYENYLGGFTGQAYCRYIPTSGGIIDTPRIFTYHCKDEETLRSRIREFYVKILEEDNLSTIIKQMNRERNLDNLIK